MPDTMTITEALAELKTIGKRIEKKREFIGSHLVRQDKFKDPLEKDGGAPKVIASERQSIMDLEQRMIAIRMAISAINSHTAVTINGVTHSIAEWLVWRRDVAPEHQAFLSRLSRAINTTREEARRKGLTVNPQGDSTRPDDVVVNINEVALSQEIEDLEAVLGALDGQLSLKNATVNVTF